MSNPETPKFETLDLNVEDGIATLTLYREERLNAFTWLMLDEFVAALDWTDGSAEVRAVVVTGRGRAFCAGLDLDEAAVGVDRAEPFDMDQHPDGGGILSRRIFDSTRPIIAAINGPAVGIGITMTLPMDARLAAEGAEIGFVFAKRGLVPEAASSFFLPRIVGISRACEWIFTGRIFRAEEALDAGLVRSIHPPERLAEEARSLAIEMSEGTSRVAVALARRMLWQMFAEGTPRLAHELDSEALHFLGGGPDVEEGIAAFLEKREASFPMRVPADLPDFYRRWAAERGGFDPNRGAGFDLGARRDGG